MNNNSKEKISIDSNITNNEIGNEEQRTFSGRLITYKNFL